MAVKYTNESFNAKLREIQADMVLVGEYRGIATKTAFQCVDGHVLERAPRDVLHNKHCPVCSRKKVVKGYNDLWTARPDVAKLLKRKREGYLNGVGSKLVTDFVCPSCGAVTRRAICKVVARGFYCSSCSDGISFPNKVLRFVLLTSEATNISFEYSPDWLGRFRYDGYFEVDQRRYVVEMDGGVGHGNRLFKSAQNDSVGLFRDCVKDLLAESHGIFVVRIDCNYRDAANRLEYIRDAMLASELYDVLRLDKIDWTECLKFCMRSFERDAAKLYDEGLTVKEISTALQVDRHTVRTWLKQAASLGLCTYTAEDSIKRMRRPLPSNATPVDQFTLDGTFVRSYISVSEARRETNILNIPACLRGVQQQSGGYVWKKHKDIYGEEKNAS